jgi:hypothetical protein
MVRVLSAGLGLDEPFTAPPPAVLEHIRVSLLAAKRTVDGLAER